MAKILLAWELGGGLGHLLPLRSISQALIERGHRVTVACWDLSRMDELFGGTGVTYTRAPFRTKPSKNRFANIFGFTHILSNIGFGDEEQLPDLLSQWDCLSDDFKPDLVVADHAPTALLALRGRNIPRVNINLGFSCPPDTFPLPFWSIDGQQVPREQIIGDELVLTEKVNRVLAQKGKPALQSLGKLFREIDDEILGTYRELDPYGERPGGRYWGHWHKPSGLEPVWPQGNGPKIFAYLKPIPALGGLLTALRESGAPTLVFFGGLDQSIITRHTCSTIRFETRPMDISKIAAACDGAILHAGHGTTASMLLAGKPCLLYPIYTEQLLTAQAVTRMKAGTWLMPTAPSMATENALGQLFSSSDYRAGAGAFSSRYKGFVPGQQIPMIVDRLEALITRSIVNRKPVPTAKLQ